MPAIPFYTAAPARDFVVAGERRRLDALRVIRMARRVGRRFPNHCSEPRARAGPLVGYPGELGTVNLTAADVETLGVSDLKKELAARGVAAPTTDPELLRTRLTDELRSSSLWGPGVVY